MKLLPTSTTTKLLPEPSGIAQAKLINSHSREEWASIAAQRTEEIKRSQEKLFVPINRIFIAGDIDHTNKPSLKIEYHRTQTTSIKTSQMKTKWANEFYIPHATLTRCIDLAESALFIHKFVQVAHASQNQELFALQEKMVSQENHKIPFQFFKQITINLEWMSEATEDINLTINALGQNVHLDIIDQKLHIYLCDQSESHEIDTADLKQIFATNFPIDHRETVVQILREHLTGSASFKTAYLASLFGEKKGLEILRIALIIDEMEVLEQEERIITAASYLADIGDIAAIPLYINILNFAGHGKDAIQSSITSEELWSRINNHDSGDPLFRYSKIIRFISELIIRFGDHRGLDFLSNCYPAFSNNKDERINLLLTFFGAKIYSEQYFTRQEGEMLDRIPREIFADPKRRSSYCYNLKSEDPNKRIKTIENYGKFGDLSCIEEIIPFLKDPSSEVREKTIWAITELRAFDLTNDIAELLHDNNEAVAAMAGIALAQLGNEKHLLEGINHQNIAAIEGYWHFNMIKYTLQLLTEDDVKGGLTHFLNDSLEKLFED